MIVEPSKLRLSTWLVRRVFLGREALAGRRLGTLGTHRQL
jgi:hypothetical protein